MSQDIERMRYIEQQAKIKGGEQGPTPVIDDLRHRIREQDEMPRHRDATDYFNRLILDLKKQLLGAPHDPITMERLDEATQHFNDLDQCVERMRFYR